MCALTENQSRSMGIGRWRSNPLTHPARSFLPAPFCPMGIYQGVCIGPWAGWWEMRSNTTRPSSPGFERPRDVERGARQSRCFIQNSAHEQRPTGASWRAEGCGEHRPGGSSPGFTALSGSSLASWKQCWRSLSPTVVSSGFHFYMFVLACVC